MTCEQGLLRLSATALGLDIPGYALSGLQKYQLPISYNSALKLTFEISMQKDKRNGLTSVFVVF